MWDVMNVASYVYHRYNRTYQCRIDEMKLHKLLYFVQRESLVVCDKPVFDAQFYGWKYGPVLKEIREAYKTDNFPVEYNVEFERELKPIVDKVFQQYAEKDSWSLSRLTHGEYSWKKSRIGVPEDAGSDRPIKLNDIRVDAQRIKERREFLSQMKLE